MIDLFGINISRLWKSDFVQQRHENRRPRFSITDLAETFPGIKLYLLEVDDRSSRRLHQKTGQVEDPRRGSPGFVSKHKELRHLQSWLMISCSTKDRTKSIIMLTLNGFKSRNVSPKIRPFLPLISGLYTCRLYFKNWYNGLLKNSLFHLMARTDQANYRLEFQLRQISEK